MDQKQTRPNLIKTIYKYFKMFNSCVAWRCRSLATPLARMARSSLQRLFTLKSHSCRLLSPFSAASLIPFRSIFSFPPTPSSTPYIPLFRALEHYSMTLRVTWASGVGGGQPIDFVLPCGRRVGEGSGRAGPGLSSVW